MKAATQLASGHTITDTSVTDEISIFLLMKEFGGTPGQWRKESTKDIKAVTAILAAYNRAVNAEMERSSKARSKGSSVKGNMSGGKFRREERVGPNGIEIVDIPM